MKRFWIHSRLGLLVGIAAILCTACEEEKTPEPVGPVDAYPARMEQLAQEGSLLRGVTRQEGTYTFRFETDTLQVPESEIAAIEEKPEEWKTRLTFADRSTLELPSLGSSLRLTNEMIKINPTGYAPLSARLTCSFPVEGCLKVRIKGKQGAAGDLTHLFPKYGYTHQEYIHGFYDNYANTLYITLTDKQGNERLTDSLTVVTPDIGLASQLPKITAVLSQPEKMEPGLTLVNFLGDNEYDTHRPFMIDADGDVRWVLLLKGHPEIGNITAHTGLKRLPNGHFYCGDVKTSRILEFDMAGNLAHAWSLKAHGYTFHHDVTVMPNGHFLATVTKDNSVNAEGTPTIFDYVVEIEPENGGLVKEWDLKKSLDSRRTTLVPAGDTVAVGGNWAHANAVDYSADDDCLIVSCRYQGIVKLTRANQVVWLLSPHKGWNNAGTLLKPKDASGNWITDPAVLAGETQRDDFDWCWGPHDPVWMPNGHLLVFDNGFFRQYEDIDLYSPRGYSRAVEYEINDAEKSIRQVWQYGKERGRVCYGVAVSSVQPLEKTGHILFSPGVGTPNANGIGGKIIEVDYQTKEVVYEAHLSTPNYLVFHRATRLPLYPDGF